MLTIELTDSEKALPNFSCDYGCSGYLVLLTLMGAKVANKEILIDGREKPLADNESLTQKYAPCIDSARAR